jgi:hypothetical protein
VVASIKSLMTSVNRFYYEGKITKADVYYSLMDHLKAADKATSPKTKANILQAFINLVLAQRGKSIASAEADLLILDAKYVIAHLK